MSESEKRRAARLLKYIEAFEAWVRADEMSGSGPRGTPKWAARNLKKARLRLLQELGIQDLAESEGQKQLGH